LPIHPNHSRVNVAEQDARTDSLLNCYRSLLALRRELPDLQSGSLDWIDTSGLPRSLIAYRRKSASADSGVDIFLNFSSQTCAIELAAYQGQTLFSSRTGSRVAAERNYRLAPHEAVILFDAASIHPISIRSR
jgi:glycosidase